MNKVQRVFAVALLLAAVAGAAWAAPLATATEESITFMREEEKLARDVYTALHEVWKLPVFSNIAASEQQHMDSVLTLIDRYGLEDPALVPGEFVNPELDALYRSLVSRGTESVEEALRVGALIEEVDIQDLATALQGDLPDDIAFVYERLLSGSYNHLQAFVSQLERYGETYEPVVLTDDEYRDAMSARSSRGPRRG